MSSGTVSQLLWWKPPSLTSVTALTYSGWSLCSVHCTHGSVSSKAASVVRP
ncbi:hypothetical protein [Nannocystis pusilla]|uniref:hypothetical protein n=1 Tax=Nannocystis pusilla TaxID=889268 RepID=UPI003B7CEAFC